LEPKTGFGIKQHHGAVHGIVILPMISFFDIDSQSLEQHISNWGESKFHATQIRQGVYQNLFNNWDQFTMLSKSLRGLLHETYSIDNFRIINRTSSNDQTTQKYLFHLADEMPIESVLMYSQNRITVCISTQSGCSIGCKFCATGKMGLKRNLTSGEIIEQVVFFQRLLNEQGKIITNLVFMGMGEPFMNFDNLINSLKVINSSDGLQIGARHITVSTIGIIPKIRDFANYFPQINLAVSLHAPENLLRNELVPVNKIFPLENLISVCRDYIKETNRRISFEYVLLNEVNDTEMHAKDLARLLNRLLCHVNLISYNPVSGIDFLPSTRKRMNIFSQILKLKGIPTTIRQSEGKEINAGCGQLAVMD
jgi:23S rRNA (adenine2503-C2)-methyltransferase